MQRTHRFAIVIITILAFAIGGAALFMLRDSSLAQLQQRGTIRIGYAVEAPYSFLKPGGAVTGEFPEVARRLAADLGIQRIEWIQVDFDALIPGLEAGRFDLIAAGMYITRERSQRVAFSEPLVHVHQGLLVRAGNPQRLHAYDQAITHPDVKIAVISGAVEQALMERIGVPKERVVVVPDARTGQASVESGVADGLALTEPTIRWMIARDTAGRIAIAQPFELPQAQISPGFGYCGFAFRKADRQLLAAWNTAQQAFVDSAPHRAIMAAYGFDETELPGTVTTEEVLSQ